MPRELSIVDQTGEGMLVVDIAQLASAPDSQIPKARSPSTSNTMEVDTFGNHLSATAAASLRSSVMETEDDTPLSRKLMSLLQSVQSLYNPEDTLEGTLERDENDPLSGESANINSLNTESISGISSKEQIKINEGSLMRRKLPVGVTGSPLSPNKGLRTPISPNLKQSTVNKQQSSISTPKPLTTARSFVSSIKRPGSAGIAPTSASGIQGRGGIGGRGSVGRGIGGRGQTRSPTQGFDSKIQQEIAMSSSGGREEIGGASASTKTLVSTLKGEGDAFRPFSTPFPASDKIILKNNTSLSGPLSGSRMSRMRTPPSNKSPLASGKQHMWMCIYICT